MIRISVCCNDDYGQLTRCAEYFQIEQIEPFDTLMEIRAETYFRVLEEEIKISRRWFKFLNRGHWCGSMAYECFTVDDDTAAEIINHLRTRGGDCEAGVSNLFEKFNDTTEPFAANDFANLAEDN